MLEFAVAPADDVVECPIAQFVFPHVGVGGCASGVVKLVAPDQHPIFGGNLGRGGRHVVAQFIGDGFAAVLAVNPNAQPFVSTPILPL